MLVSIIIPAYNRSELLKEAIQSAMEQTYRPIECIVVDDGSTDNTKEVVEKLAKETDSDFNLKYIFQHNAGSQAARNTGTTAATGEFIQYLDSDDLLYPGKLSAQIDYFKLHPGCDAVFGDWETGTIDKKEKVIAYKSDNLIAQFLTEKCIANFAILMRSSLVKKIGDWDVNIKRNQEIDFHLRGVLADGNFDYKPQSCGLWRIHNDERIANATGLRDISNFYRKWETLLKEKNKFTPLLSCKIADMFIWFVSQNKNSADKELIEMLKDAIRLNPSIGMNKSIKLKIIKNLVGKDLALKLWLSQFRHSTRVA